MSINKNTPPPSNENPKAQEKMKRGFDDFWDGAVRFFRELVNLREGMDREGTIVNIKNNKRMAGANAWLLMCSIMIASLGLDLNSPAVIIGAMLISPLMSPILGIGLAVGINDRKTLTISLKHFGISIVIAVATSTFYFFLTPFGELTNEIVSRTKPTLLDVLVAFFGGIAGIISGSRKDTSNAIPGVAIATALMPPLCVTGFGIANQNLTIIANSFYLFFLNATFVALATYIIVRHLQFPVVAYSDRKDKRRTRFILAIMILVLVLPSAYILYGVLGEIRTKRNIGAFLQEYCNDDYKYIDAWEHLKTDSSSTLILKVYGNTINENKMDYYKEGLEAYNLGNTVIEIISTSEIDVGKFKQLQTQIQDFEGVYKQLEATKEAQSMEDSKVVILNHKLDSLRRDTIPFQDIIKEAKVLFPQLERLAFTKGQVTDFKVTEKDLPILLVRWERAYARKNPKRDEAKLSEFVKIRAKLDTIDLVRF